MLPAQLEPEPPAEASRPPAPCVNLKERYGDRYRLGWDPADESGHRDPWMMVLLCQRAVIYPHGGDQLAVEVDGHPVTARRLAELGLRCTQDGDHEKTFVFPLERFEEVAALVLPRRRRQLTPEQREAAMKNLRPFPARGPDESLDP
jgi:hypothetical protein